MLKNIISFDYFLITYFKTKKPTIPITLAKKSNIENSLFRKDCKTSIKKANDIKIITLNLIFKVNDFLKYKKLNTKKAKKCFILSSFSKYLVCSYISFGINAISKIIDNIPNKRKISFLFVNTNSFLKTEVS